MNIKILVALGLGILAASSAEAQSVFYSQPYDGVGYSPSFIRGIINVPSYDDFTLSAGGTVTQVDWTGVIPVQSIPINGFDVAFLSDDFGRAGSLLASDYISGDAGQTPTGSLYSYNYTAAVAPFSAAPGIEYFLSIQANIDDGSWDWGTSSVGNNGGYYFLGLNNPIKDNGLAFTLQGTQVPEPSTIALGVLGASAFLLRRRT